MPYIKPSRRKSRAKRLNSLEFTELANKIAHLDEMKALKSTKNAKLAKKAKKERKIEGLDPNFVSFDDLRAYGEPIRTTVSTPNPNEAFRWHKRKKDKDFNDMFDHSWVDDIF